MDIKKIIKTGSLLTLLSALLFTSTVYAQSAESEGGITQAVYDAAYRSAGFYLLLFILACVFIGIIGKVLRVYELTSEIQGRGGKINWNRVQSFLFVVILILSLYGTYWTYSTWSWVHTPAGSVHGERWDFMFSITLIVTTIVMIITHILLFGFAFKYKGSENRRAYFYPHNNALERVWTVVPAIALTILVLLGFVTWRSITNVPPDEQKKAINVEVVGEQFKWTIRYAGADNELGNRNYKLTTSTNVLGIDFTDRKSWDDKLAGQIVLPVNRPVRFTLGSKDILHSFYIPTMRVQMNTVPGMPTYFQFTPRFTTEEMRAKNNNPEFDYILLCNKICGAGHYNMQAKVVVVSEKEYEEWLIKQQLFYNDDIKKEMQMAEEKKASAEGKLVLNN